jgi:hypothetical protein
MPTRTFDEIANAQGWSDASRVAVLLRYIENQDSNEAFIDFLEREAEEEDEMAESCDPENLTGDMCVLP